MRLQSKIQLPTALAVTLWVVKIVAIVVGLILSWLCAMSATSTLTQSLLVQLLPAVVLVGLPLVAVERLARDERGRRREGLATDLLALFWLGFAVLYIVGAFPVTSPLLLREAELLHRSGSRSVARTSPAVAWLARRRPGRLISTSESADDASVRLGLEPEEVADGGAGAEPASDGDVGVSAEGDAEAVQPELPVLGPAELLEQLAPALVTLSIRRTDGRDVSATGLIIDAQGTVVTSATALRWAQSVAVRRADGVWLEEVILLGRDLARELAVLATVDGEPPTAWARVGRPEEVAPGAQLYVLGNPLGLAPTLADGELLSVRELSGQPRWEISAPLGEQNAGGPVVTDRGEVVAVALGGVPVRSLRPGGAPPVFLAAPVQAAALLTGPDSGLHLFGRGAPPPLSW